MTFAVTSAQVLKRKYQYYTKITQFKANIWGKAQQPSLNFS